MKDSVATVTRQLESQLLMALWVERSALSQRAFGESFNLGSASNVWQLLQGRRALSLKSATKFAKGLNVELARFSPRLAAEYQNVILGMDQAAQLAAEQNYELVPCVSLTLKDGSPAVDIRPMSAPVAAAAFRHDWLAAQGLQTKSLLAVTCIDDAMRPTIALNDLVVINAADKKPADSAVFAVNYEGQLQVRRMFRDAGEWWLHCDNPEVQRYPRRLFIQKHCFIIGKIVHRSGRSL